MSSREAWTPFDKALGQRIRQIRMAAGVTTDQLADVAQFLGLSWQRPTVAALEEGRRRFLASEMVLLPLVMERATKSRWTLSELLDLDCALTEEVEITAEGMRRVLAGEELDSATFTMTRKLDEAIASLASLSRREAEIRPEVAKHLPVIEQANVEGASARRSVRLAASREAEQKAARSLGLSADEVAAISIALWGQGFSAERDRRAEDRVQPDEAPRSLQAVRGRVSRELMREIRAYVSSGEE